MGSSKLRLGGGGYGWGEKEKREGLKVSAVYGRKKKTEMREWNRRRREKLEDGHWKINWSSQRAQTDNFSLSHPTNSFTTAHPRWLLPVFYLAFLCVCVCLCVCAVECWQSEVLKCAEKYHFRMCAGVHARLHVWMQQNRKIIEIEECVNRISCKCLCVSRMPDSRKVVPESFEWRPQPGDQ